VRQLMPQKRRFVQQVGVSAKPFARIEGFEPALERDGLLAQGSWTEVACCFRYYDQMQMVHDFHGRDTGPNAATFRSGTRAADDGNPVRTRPAVCTGAMGRISSPDNPASRDLCKRIGINMRVPPHGVMARTSARLHQFPAHPQQ
jgi:hypothetical protein